MPVQLQWRPTNAPVASSRTDDIWFHDEQTGWAVNSNGQILKTTDGFETFQEQFQDANVYLRCAGFADDQKGWVGTLTPAKRLYQTNNGGQSWSLVTNLPAEPVAICGISVVNDQVIYGSGTNFPWETAAIIKTDNGGTSWSLIDMSDHASLLVDCHFASPDEGWVVGGKADQPNTFSRDDVSPVVLHTTDGGATWNNVVENVAFPQGEWGWKIQFLNDQVGFVALENFDEGAILRTLDGGATWQRRVVNDQQIDPEGNPTSNANLEGIGFVDQDNGWVGGWGDRTFQTGFSSSTSDGGANWQAANDIGQFINRFRFFGNPVTVGYASGRTVYKYSSEPAEPSPETAAAFAAAAALPVECDGPATISYTVGQDAARASIEIWDRFGQHIRTLCDVHKPAPGPHTAVWDFTDQQGKFVRPGIYIYRITVDGRAQSNIIRLNR